MAKFSPRNFQYLISFITSFRWDTNDTDNTLTAICKSDKLFDLPPGTAMPTLRCEARCSAQKPVPPASYGLELGWVHQSSLLEIIWDKFHQC